MNKKVKKLFTTKPSILYIISHKISSYLVRAKLYPSNRTVGCYKYGKKCCAMCKYITQTDTFTSTVTKPLR